MNEKLSPDLFDVKEHSFSRNSLHPAIDSFYTLDSGYTLSSNQAFVVALKQVKDGLTGRKILDHYLFIDFVT
jgi:hypothetical protein